MEKVSWTDSVETKTLRNVRTQTKTG